MITIKFLLFLFFIGVEVALSIYLPFGLLTGAASALLGFAIGVLGYCLYSDYKEH